MIPDDDTLDDLVRVIRSYVIPVGGKGFPESILWAPRSLLGFDVRVRCPFFDSVARVSSIVLNSPNRELLECNAPTGEGHDLHPVSSLKEVWARMGISWSEVVNSMTGKSVKEIFKTLVTRYVTRYDGIAAVNIFNNEVIPRVQRSWAKMGVIISRDQVKQMADNLSKRSPSELVYTDTTYRLFVFNSLATLDRFRWSFNRKGVSKCRLCREYKENVEHLFLTCNKSISFYGSVGVVPTVTNLLMLVPLEFEARVRVQCAIHSVWVAATNGIDPVKTFKSCLRL